MGPYELIEELRHTAIAVYFDAIHETDGRRVMLILDREPNGLVADEEPTSVRWLQCWIDRLPNEVHPHAIEICDRGDLSGRPFLAAESLRGPTLRDQIRAKDAQSPEAISAGLADIADAIHAMHKADLLHLALSPSCITVHPERGYVLHDFGFARSPEAPTRASGESLGIPLQMTPEQMIGSAADARTDVYGLGTLLFSALTGEPLFLAETLAVLMRRTLLERPRPVHLVNPRVPRSVSDIVAKCLEKQQHKRFSDARALAAALRDPPARSWWRRWARRIGE